MPDAVSTAVANHGIGLVFTELVKAVKSWRSVREECLDLQQKLNMCVAFTDDMIRREDNRTNVGTTYDQQVRELVHDIEDCIERFLYRIECQDGARRRLHRIAHKIQTLPIRYHFAKEIKKLQKRSKKAGIDQLISHPDGRTTPTTGPAPAGGQREPFVPSPVGIAQAKLEVLTLLDDVVGEPPKLRVIAIVGYGGSGKTTLASAVYQSPEATGLFPLRAWVDRADYENAIGLLKSIIKKLWHEATVDDESSDERALQAYLKGRLDLENQRYLIVLDDMDMTNWNWVERTFQDNGTSSRIIVTTSSLRAANYSSNGASGNGFVYHMRKLGDEGSKRIACLTELAPDAMPSQALRKKCDGLPLALVSVANHFRSEGNRGCPTISDCESLCNKLGSCLHKNHLATSEPDAFADLRGVLMNNYRRLPAWTLRNSLLYVGMFPDPQSLKRNKITRRWVAEGYAPSNKDPQAQADDNFKELIDMSIIQPVGISSSRTCRALGIVHEFVLHKSMSENFIMVSDSAAHSIASTGNKRHRRVRHLFVRGSNIITSSGASVNVDLSHVRSLTVVTATDNNGDNNGSGRAGDGSFEFSKYKVIRVLDLEECTEVNNSHLENICKLWNLRYLSLGREVNKLPKEVARLKRLERLHLSKTVVTELPEDIIGMPYLAHLVGKFILLVPAEPQSTEPKVLGKSKESKLVTLSGIVATERQGFFMVVPHMTKLRKVKISFGDPSRETTVGLNDHLLPAIKGYLKHRLEYNVSRSLSIDFRSLYGTGYESFSRDVMKEWFLDPSCYLTSLKLHAKLLTSMPQFVALLSGLTELCLSLQSLGQDLLSAASELHDLVHLKLMADVVREGEDRLIIQDGKLQSLTSLCIEVRGPECPAPEIKFQGHLPELRYFQLICKNVANLCGVEISRFTKLQEIELHPEVSYTARKHYWETAARSHRNRPSVLPFLIVDDSAVEVVGAAQAGNQAAVIASPGATQLQVDGPAAAIAAAHSAPANQDPPTPLVPDDTGVSPVHRRKHLDTVALDQVAPDTDPC